MKRVKIVVAYDGTNYCGWQVQPNGLSVQEVLEKHLSDPVSYTHLTLPTKRIV